METFAEEKKELEVRDTKDFSDGDGDSDSDVGAELIDLPPQLSALKEKTYEFWEDLEKDLKERECADLNVVIDPVTSRARLRVTKGAHDLVTDLFAADFRDTWGGNRWAAVAESSSVLIQPQVPGGKVTRRKPDIAYWGFPKCTATENRRGKLLARKMNPPPPNEQVDKVHPDVVFQFSWGNSKGYEEKALNDMMNRASVLPFQPYNEAPRLGFLLKVRKKSKRTRRGRKIISGIDLYRVPRGCTVADAEANRNGASHIVYSRGGLDVSVEITAHDLGIEGFWAWVCRKPYTISLEEICELLD